MRPVDYPPTDEGVIVAFSGGKDSLVVLDLAIKRFARVDAFFMYLVPDLDYSRLVVEYAQERFKIPVRQYPHWGVSRYLADGAFCDGDASLKSYGMQGVIRHARVDTGLHWCGLGYRVQESMLQRRWLGSRNGWTGAFSKDGRWAPLRDWRRQELLAYLRAERIAIPGMSASTGYRPSGVGLDPDALEWLRRCWPRDYARILAHFPWAGAQADRHDTLKAHKKAWADQYRAQRKAYDLARGTAASRGYGYGWQQLRAEILAEEPWCRTCRGRGLTVPATNVDHIETRRTRLELGLDPDARDNLQPLCQSCHSSKTATRDSAWARAS